MRIRYKLASCYLIIGLCVSMIALFEGLAIYREYLNGLQARKDSSYPFEVQLELSGVSRMDRDSFEEIWEQEKYRSLNVKMKGPIMSANETSYKWELTLLLASNIPERIWLTNGERLYLPKGEQCIAAGRNRYRHAEYEDGNRYISLEDQERFLVTGEIGVEGSDIQDGMLVMRFEAFPKRWEPLLTESGSAVIWLQGETPIDDELVNQAANEAARCFPGAKISASRESAAAEMTVLFRTSMLSMPVLLYLFCGVILVQISFFWIKARKKELLLRKSFGYSNGRLILFLLKEILYLFLVSIVLYGVGSAAYRLFTGGGWKPTVYGQELVVFAAYLAGTAVICLLVPAVWLCRWSCGELLNEKQE